MHRGKLIRGLFVVPMLALGIMGCRSGSEETTTASTAKAGATSAASSAATSAAKASTAAATAASKTGTTGGFGTLFGQFRNAEFKITYDVTGANMPGPSSMTIAQWTDRSRVDITSSMGGMSIFELPQNKKYMCMAQMNTCIDTSSGTTIPGLDSNPMVNTLEDYKANAANYQTTEIEARTIAGVRGQCFKYTGPASSGTTCISASGQMLLTESTTSAGTFSMTATKVEGKPPASDFELPFPVGTMPGFGASGVPGMPGGMPNFPGGVPTAPVR